MTTPTHLRALQAIELALRKGSLKAAAAELSITPAALGQRIKHLEDYLGYDLLVRGRSGIRPTPALREATAHLGAAFRELETTCRILDFNRVNELHVTADSDWADLWLRPRLQSFRKDNPNTLFCINGVGDVPMRLGDADCEVWFGSPRKSPVEDELFHDYILPINSPDNTRRTQSRPAAEQLDGLPLLHLDCYTKEVDDAGWTEWVRQYGHRTEAPGRGIRYQKVMHALEAVYAGAGFLMCGYSLVRPMIEKGELCLSFPLAEGIVSKNAYRVRFTTSAIKRTPVERFRAWLLAEAEMTAAEIRAIRDKQAAG